MSKTVCSNHLSAAELRCAIRERRFTRPTAGAAPGFVQANVVILPAELAADFESFCRENTTACPLLERTAPGNPEPLNSAPGADLRTDVPWYRVFRLGVREAPDLPDIRELWRDDFVGFLLGCSFTFEHALVAARLPVRHIEEGRNVPMYRTRIACQSVGPFAGPLVVSMRPYMPELIEQVAEVTRHYPTMHGGPIHVGDPAILGIADLDRPEFGDRVSIREGEVPVFWACGVTPQLALEVARPPIAITHSPGHMFVTDLSEQSAWQP